MKKLAAVFVIAVLGPALVLAWLATRSLRDQELVVHSQRALLHQGATDALARDMNLFFDEVRVFYGSLLEQLIGETGPEALAADFDAIIRSRWSQAAVGAALTEDGMWISPSPTSEDPSTRRFLLDTQAFLTNQAPSEVYRAPATTGTVVTVESNPLESRSEEGSFADLGKMAPAVPAAAAAPESEAAPALAQSAPRRKVAAGEQALREREKPGVGALSGIPAPPSEKDAFNGAMPRNRNVQPFSQIDASGDKEGFAGFAQAASEALADNPNRLAWSNLEVSSGQLRELMGDDVEGAISRFVSGGLQVLLWRRDPAAPGKVFWVQLDLAELRDDLAAIVATREAVAAPEACLALLDASGEVVARTTKDFTTDWRKPFVATEVGEILPHWEVAAYLLDPQEVARSARGARLVLWMLVLLLLLAIGTGGYLIMRETGREMRLARQKTDFVSNVSHELKTPLTSIRMFSDLLGKQRELDEGKRLEYSGIISRESARLGRLINQLLDFSRMDRGEKRYRMEPVDLGEMVAETVAACSHLNNGKGVILLPGGNAGEPGAPPVVVTGDRDALSQVLLNLLSNAEKYGGDSPEISLEMRCLDGRVEIAVLDRGPGVPRRLTEKVFEKFYRADDSLASGIEGTGLGLTLARQIARAHDGDVLCEPREGGGSRFVLVLPLA